MSAEGGMFENSAGRMEQRAIIRAYGITLRVQSYLEVLDLVPYPSCLAIHYASNSETDLQVFD